MRPITFLAALVAALQLLSSTAVASGDWTWPVHGDVITPYRNGTDPYAAGQHRGIDIASPVGSPVVAATRGTVTFAGIAGSSGLTVSIRTADGRFDTSYLHLSSESVDEGDSVSAGQRIGAVGTSGKRSAEQPHLHFGVREAGSRQSYRDPLDFLAPLAAPPRPQPAPAPHSAPAPVASHAPIPRPAAAPVAAALGAPPVRSQLPTPRALASALRAPRPAAAGPHGHPGAAGPSVAPRGHASVAAPAAHAAGHAQQRAGSALHSAQQPAHARGSPRHVSLGSGPAGAATPARVAANAPSRASVAAKSHHGGFDAGWLVACIGLVCAACALGRPDGTKTLAIRGRDAFATLLRPLGGRG